MERNYGLKFNKHDLFISIFALILLIAILITTNIIYGNINSKEDRLVKIYLKNEVIYELDYNSQTKYTEVTLSKENYNNLLGDMIIIIDPINGICVKDVVCPNHICKNQGYVKLSNIPITCVPNNVVIMIVNKKISKKDLDIVV